MDSTAQSTSNQKAAATMEALDKIRQDLAIHCDTVISSLDTFSGRTDPSRLSSNQMPSGDEQRNEEIWNPESSNRGEYTLSLLFEVFFSKLWVYEEYVFVYKIAFTKMNLPQSSFYINPENNDEGNLLLVWA